MKIMQNYSWVKGFNYVPSHACNDIDFWRDYDKELVERELGYAKRLGLNCARPFLCYVVYKQNPGLFLEKLLHFVRTAYALGIYTMPVVWDSCTLYGEEEPDAKMRVNRWLANPGSTHLSPEDWPELEKYCDDLIRTLFQEPGLLLWDIHNEPLMTGYVFDHTGDERKAREERVWTFVRHFCDFFHQHDPVNPLTVGVAFESEMEYIQASCDVLSFHDYSPAKDQMDAAYKKSVAFAASVNKPVFCSEMCCTARANPYEIAIQVADENHIGYFIWELMVGKSFWNNRHGIVYPDGTIRDPSAVAAIYGFYRNRTNPVSLEMDVEGAVTRVIVQANQWIAQEHKKSKDGRLILQTMANLLECGEMVPMNKLPSMQAQAVSFDSPQGEAEACRLMIRWMNVLQQDMMIQ